MAEQPTGQPDDDAFDWSLGQWVRGWVAMTRRGNRDESEPFDLELGFELDHWLAATGGIPAGLLDRDGSPDRRPTPIRARPIVSVAIALLIVTAGLLAAANISMPSGAVGEPADPAAAGPTPTDDGSGGDDDRSGTVAATATPAPTTTTVAPTATATATPTPTPTATPTPTDDGLVGTVDDAVDSTGDTVDDTVDSTGDTVDDTLDSGGDTVDDTTGGSVGDTVDSTSDSVDDTADSTGDTVDDTSDDLL